MLLNSASLLELDRIFKEPAEDLVSNYTNGTQGRQA